MSVIDVFLSRAVRCGQLTLHRPGKPAVTFGEPTTGFGRVALRFADAGVERAIVRSPSVRLSRRQTIKPVLPT